MILIKMKEAGEGEGNTVIELAIHSDSKNINFFQLLSYVVTSKR